MMIIRPELVSRLTISLVVLPRTGCPFSFVSLTKVDQDDDDDDDVDREKINFKGEKENCHCHCHRNDGAKVSWPRRQTDSVNSFHSHRPIVAVDLNRQRELRREGRPIIFSFA